jgi:hypothetical protein
MTLLTQLKQLQTIDQQHQELTAKLQELERQQEELAKSILHSPNCPHEAHLQIDSSTIAWIDHPDNWADNELRSGITFHNLTLINA